MELILIFSRSWEPKAYLSSISDKIWYIIKIRLVEVKVSLTHWWFLGERGGRRRGRGFFCFLFLHELAGWSVESTTLSTG